MYSIYTLTCLDAPTGRMITSYGYVFVLQPRRNELASEAACKSKNDDRRDRSGEERGTERESESYIYGIQNTRVHSCESLPKYWKISFVILANNRRTSARAGHKPPIFLLLSLLLLLLFLLPCIYMYVEYP